MKKKFTCVLLSLLLILAGFSTVSAATDASSTKIAPTFDELKQMFPQARIVPVDEDAKTFVLREAILPNSVPTATYVKYDGDNEHHLDVFSDGSYISYGNVINQSRASGSAYYGLTSPAYMYLNYTYTTDSAGKYILTSASNGSSNTGTTFVRWVISNAVLQNSKHAYRKAEGYNLIETYEWFATCYLRVKVNDSTNKIYVERD